MRTKYQTLVDGEDVYLRSSQVFKFACCDCGLVHDIALVARRGGHINMALRRNKRATAARRRAPQTIKLGNEVALAKKEST